MQLKKKTRLAPGSISGALAAATCTLLAQPLHATEEDGWQIDTSVLYYSETDRVSATEPVIRARRQFADESQLDLKVTLDSLTGPSHNGGLVASQPQTYTTPSGSAFSVAPGEVPLDDAFKDTRVAFNTQYLRPINRTLRWTAGANVSNEYDFQSLGVNGGLIWDLNQKNTTLSLAFSHEADTIDAVGDVPVGLSLMTNEEREGGSESRSVNDVLLGWTQVMSRSWIMQLNYNLSVSSGYHTDPYKVLTLVDGAGNPVEAESLGAPDIGPGDAHVFEQRPDSRTKHALYWENRYHLSDDVMALSYRYTTDDWGINSHTLDLKYRWQLADDWYLQPHVRYYTQSAADFWHESLTVPEYNAISAAGDEASADYRLGDLTDTTLGLKVGHALTRGREWNARLELYQQSGDSDAADIDAVITQIGYTFNW